MKKFKTLVVLVITILLQSLVAAPALKKEELILFSENVIIPLPSEVFMALDQLTNVDWGRAVEYNYSSDYAENHILALNLGVRIADGFIATQAKDKVNAGTMFSVCRDLANNFGASNGSMIDKEKLLENINSGNWYQIRQMLDELQLGIKNEMRKYHPDFVVLASIGGWLEGLRVVSASLKENYSKDLSSILYQPVLISYLINKIETFSSENFNNRNIQKIYSGLKEVKVLSDAGSGNPVAEENVKKIFTISSMLIETIVKGA